MLAGYRVFADRPGADRSKEVRAEPLAAQVQGGNVFLHAGTWQRDLLDEIESLAERQLQGPGRRLLGRVQSSHLRA